MDICYWKLDINWIDKYIGITRQPFFNAVNSMEPIYEPVFNFDCIDSVFAGERKEVCQ